MKHKYCLLPMFAAFALAVIALPAVAPAPAKPAGSAVVRALPVEPFRSDFQLHALTADVSMVAIEAKAEAELPAGDGAPLDPRLSVSALCYWLTLIFVPPTAPLFPRQI